MAEKPSERDDGPTADQLRKEIDSGEGGDKADIPDPAAAPLGADAEAGGNAATREQLKRAREQEVKTRPSEDGAEPDAPDGS